MVKALRDGMGIRNSGASRKEQFLGKPQRRIRPREIPFSFGRMENWAILNSRLITKLKRETAEFSIVALLNRESMTVGELVDIRLIWKQAISFLAYVMEKAFGVYSPCVV